MFLVYGSMLSGMRGGSGISRLDQLGCFEVFGNKH